MTDFRLHGNPGYGHGTPTGERGTVEIYGRRCVAVRQGWHLGRVWCQIATDPREWFKVSIGTAETFTRP